MSSAPPPARPERARPVADAPVGALLARSQELARRWAVALILARPLAEMTELPLEEIARSAPALCEAIARTLATEEPLDRFGAPGEPALASLRALAAEPAALVADVEMLRAILWEVTLEELREPPARLLADTAGRLAYVCATALAATLRAPGEGAPVRAEPRASVRVPYRTERVAGERAAGAVLVDELGVEPRPLASVEGSPERTSPREDDAATVHAHASGSPSPHDVRASASSASEPARATPRPRPWDTPLGEEPAMRVRRGPGAPVDERR